MTPQLTGRWYLNVGLTLILYIRGWLQYFKLSSTYTEVLELSQWVRRRVRLYYWKQWKQPPTRRRHLLALGADPDKVHMATRSRKGYWRTCPAIASGDGG